LREQFILKARLLAKDCLLEGPLRRSTGRMLQGDARVLAVDSASVAAIVTSPPYWITYDYVTTQRLSYLAFNWSIPPGLQMGRRYGISPDGVGFKCPPALAEWYVAYGGERTTLGRALREYIQGMRQHLAEVRRVLRKDGVAAYSLANSVRSGTTFDLVQGFVELAEEAGLRLPEVETRDITHRRILPSGRDTATGRFSSEPTPGISETLVFLRK